MAASTIVAAPANSREIHTGSRASVITALEANNLKTKSGKLGHIVVWNVGSGATIDVYDDPAANNNPIWQWVTVDGKNTYPLQIPFKNGLRVNVSGAGAPSLTVVYS